MLATLIRLLGDFELAEEIPGATTDRLVKLAAELDVAIVASLFERRAAGVFHNTAAVIDGRRGYVGKYRKMHIPDDPRYYEKFYFTPGDLGFKSFHTQAAELGVLVCWDQWYPEAARLTALRGAQVLLYPTAIGSEPHDASIDSRDHWQRCMQGHAAANVMPLVASNRIGVERGQKYEMTFYGSSFIADATGEKLVEADRVSEAVITATIDLEQTRAQRHAWGVFRDRRPDYVNNFLDKLANYEFAEANLG